MASLGLLGAGEGLANELLDDYQDQRKRQRDLSDYETKAKFAMDLQTQLMQKKLQLAQQYPTYSHFVTNPVTGDVTGFTPFGQASQLSQGDPLQKQMYEALKQSTVNKNLADAQYLAARPDLMATQQLANLARTNYYNARANAPQKQAADPAALTSADFYKRVEQLAQQADPDAFAKQDPNAAFLAGPGGASQLNARKQTALAAAEAKLRQQGIYMKGEQKPSGGLLSSGTSSDDNDFMNAGQEDDDNPENF